VTELVALAISGLCMGAGMGAAKQRAPRSLAASCYVLAAVAFVAAVLILVVTR
jgi:hypothetical protein